MKLHDLSLSATHSNWRLFMVRKSDKGFLAFQQKVFLRDNHTCQFCGFKAERYMDVVNLDRNFHHNHISNLITACCLCSQCFFMESIGRDEYGGGVLIVLPEITQNQLNALCHILLTAIVSGSATATQARNIYRSLKLRSQQAEKLLGEGLSQPALLGRLLVDYGEKVCESIQKKLAHSVRLLPDLQRFAEPITTWIKDSLEQVS